MDGERRENGESWCEYEGKTGEGKDLVGSRQYVHKCLNGREIIDTCKTERKQICVQGVQPKELTGLNKDITTARCMENKPEICLTANSEEAQDCELENFDLNQCGGECDVLKDLNQEEFRNCCEKQLCRKQTCEELNVASSCYWNDNVKLCAPNVPLGTLRAVAEDDKQERQDLQEPFKYECKELWAIEGSETFFNWYCVANCYSDSQGMCYKSRTANDWNS